MVSKVLLELLDGIFNERFLKIKNVDKIKNVKKKLKRDRNKKLKKRFYIYAVRVPVMMVRARTRT